MGLDPGTTDVGLLSLPVAVAVTAAGIGDARLAQPGIGGRDLPLHYL
jgi:hypothetical protein